MYGESTVQALHFAVDALAQGSDLRANNIANLNTPGFRAREVGFAEQLRAALQRGDVAAAEPASTQATPTFPDANGNTVDLEHELTSMMQGGLLRNALVNAINHRHGTLRTAITGQAR